MGRRLRNQRRAVAFAVWLSDAPKSLLSHQGCHSIYCNTNSSLPARSRRLSTSQPYRAPLLPSQELETSCDKIRPPRQKLSSRTRSRRRCHRVDLNESST
jgi:hypothetical protein